MLKVDTIYCFILFWNRTIDNVQDKSSLLQIMFSHVTTKRYTNTGVVLYAVLQCFINRVSLLASRRSSGATRTYLRYYILITQFNNVNRITEIV